ncbi:MAG: hypothetical protein ABMB14_24070 [Myxococcota bacterium]
MTPFLAGFAEAVVRRLVAEGSLEVSAGGEDQVVWFVANWLGTNGPGNSLLSTLEAALLACPEVDELYADLDRLKAVVDDLG